MTKEVKIKFIPTGNIFSLPEYEVKRILEYDRGNYEIIGKKGNIEKIIEKTTYEKVVNEVENYEVKPLSKYNYQELKKFAKENNLATTGNTETLLARCIEFTKQEAEKNEIDKTEEVTNDD